MTDHNLDATDNQLQSNPGTALISLIVSLLYAAVIGSGIAFVLGTMGTVLNLRPLPPDLDPAYSGLMFSQPAFGPPKRGELQGHMSEENMRRMFEYAPMTPKLNPAQRATLRQQLSTPGALFEYDRPVGFVHYYGSEHENGVVWVEFDYRSRLVMDSGGNVLRVLHVWDLPTQTRPVSDADAEPMENARVAFAFGGGIALLAAGLLFLGAILAFADAEAFKVLHLLAACAHILGVLVMLAGLVWFCWNFSGINANFGGLHLHPDRDHLLKLQGIAFFLALFSILYPWYILRSREFKPGRSAYDGLDEDPAFNV